MRYLRPWLLAALLALLLGACASTAEEEADELSLGYQEINDPLEPFNRAVFDFNILIDAVLLRPIAEPYQALVPEFVRDIVRNLVRLAHTPVDLANAILQGDLDAMENITARLLINATLGGGGLFDVAKDSGYPYRREDFGQTLAVWGVEPGFYLVLPIFGPSSGRDTAGRVVDIFLDPLTYVGGFDLAGIDGINGGIEEARVASLGITLADGIDTRGRNLDTLDELQRDSVDFYARIRSLWHQNRLAEIRNGEPGDAPLPAFPDDLLDEDFDLEDPPTEEGEAQESQ